LACKAGCSWCCHISVDVRPVEVFGILEFVAQHLAPAEQSRVRAEIEGNSAILAKLSDLERVQRNLKCPFLAAGRCAIYAARPQTCRNYHATNAAGCQRSYEEPNNLDIDPDFAPLVYQAGGAHVDAFSKAMGDAGYDIAAYELSTALAAAMADPDAIRKSFENKQATFAGLQGLDVATEFMDLDD
jgi:Fe-S-cluster containining protein